MRAINRIRKVTCVICGQDFHTNHSQGRYCSPVCRRAGWRTSWRKYGDKNKVHRQHYGQTWYEKNKEKRLAQIKAYKQTPAGKLSTSNNTKNQMNRHPERVMARQLVKRALSDGTLIKKPCQVCGEKAQAHHDDYSKPLDVKWLCGRHHKEYEKRMVKNGQDTLPKARFF